MPWPPWLPSHIPYSDACLQKTEFNTPEKLKALLDEKGINYDSSSKTVVLRGLAKRCLKRALIEMQTDVDRETSILLNKAMNVSSLLSRIEETRIEQPIEKVWIRTPVKGVFDEFYTRSVLKLKHNVTESPDMTTCFGIVEDGKCKKCGEHTPGVVAYSFEFSMMDFHDQSKCVHLSGAQSAGIGFFGMSAREFNTLTETERKNKMMNMMYKPFIFNTMVEYRLKDNHAHANGYNVRPLPDTVLPEEW